MTHPAYLTRALFAIIVALLVLGTTCYGSWVALWSVPVSNRFMWAHGSLLYIEEALEKYKAAKAQYPDSLEELSSVVENLRLDDPWQREFHYASKGQTYQLCSLGRDGQPGGAGFDTDIYVDTALSDMPLPLSQFFFQARGSGASLLVAFLAALCAGATSYLSIIGNQIKCLYGHSFSCDSPPTQHWQLSSLSSFPRTMSLLAIRVTDYGICLSPRSQVLGVLLPLLDQPRPGILPPQYATARIVSQ